MKTVHVLAALTGNWCAYHDGEEASNHVGFGATPSEALADLRRLDTERAEASEPGDRLICLHGRWRRP